MEERFLQQLKKGVLELLVLQTICRGPTYGYELISQLGSRSGGVYAPGGDALPDFVPAGGRRADRGRLAAGVRARGPTEDLFRDGKGQRRKRTPSRPLGRIPDGSGSILRGGCRT